MPFGHLLERNEKDQQAIFVLSANPWRIMTQILVGLLPKRQMQEAKQPVYIPAFLCQFLAYYHLVSDH
jgi:hypothetical protein